MTERLLVRASGLGLALVLGLAGCAGNTISGRVVKGDASFMQWVQSTASASGEPIPGAAITVVRDPLSPGRTTVGNGVSQENGTFTITLDAFGAGWTDESWLIVAERRGVGRAEYIGRMGSGSLLVILAPGTDRGAGTADLWNGSIDAMPAGSSIMDEAKRYR